ncbi:glycosyltransferase family 20-domain-containing protein [Boletus reticuloceps]|uniref:Glycosyltransferase family 20-domain-containing protein n=1 Tax=Boletus reticuloceps TaxID=495285 RepID=A0A8I2YH92_9AGAM|nr:glycosyltransferase family 20-domain-containing protein [Boletus reticuloceps]
MAPSLQLMPVPCHPLPSSPASTPRSTSHDASSRRPIRTCTTPLVFNADSLVPPPAVPVTVIPFLVVKAITHGTPRQTRTATVVSRTRSTPSDLRTLGRELHSGEHLDQLVNFPTIKFGIWNSNGDACKQLAHPRVDAIALFWTKHVRAVSECPRLFYESASFKQYMSVDNRFAEVFIANYREGDIVWINDYHLMLLPVLLRANHKLANTPIGFFLHIIFLSSKIFRCLSDASPSYTVSTQPILSVSKAPVMPGISGRPLIASSPSRPFPRISKSKARLAAVPVLTRDSSSASASLCQWVSTSMRCRRRGVGRTHIGPDDVDTDRIE